MRPKEKALVRLAEIPARPSARQVADYLKEISLLRPRLALVLGSGFQAIVGEMEIDVEVPYTDLPGFPAPTVDGHRGKLLIGEMGRTPVLVLSGRAHYYEGYSMAAITFPIRVLAEYGIRDLVLTNAAGGINRRFRAGDFMVIQDHINFMPENPLRGELPQGLPRFVDLTQVYDPGLSRLLKQAGKSAKLRLHSGVYLAVSGPSYETPTEIRAFERLGADAVGMSTVPEAIVARQHGLAVAGISCITNLAAGRSKGPLSHTEVLATAQRMQAKLGAFFRRFAELYRAAKENVRKSKHDY